MSRGRTLNIILTEEPAVYLEESFWRNPSRRWKNPVLT